MGEGGCMCVVGEKKKKKKKMRWVRGMYVCSGGEEKRKAGDTWVVGGKKGNKKEKRNGEWNLRVWWEKRGSGKERKKKF
jgi:hypothetical protein